MTTAITMPPVSYTGASKFEQCPARYKAEKIDKVQTLKPLYLVTGIFLHEVNDQYDKYLQGARLRIDLHKLKSIFEKLWVTDRGSIPGVMREDLLDLAVRVAESRLKYDPERTVGSEIQMAFDASWNKVAWADPKARYRGKLDRLEFLDNWIALVWDLKTGWGVENPEDSMQLKVYGHFVRVLFPNTAGVVSELFYPRFRATRAHTLTVQDLDAGQRWIEETAAGIEEAHKTGQWPARAGSWCADCPVYRACPTRNAPLTDVPPGDLAEAEQLAERLLTVDREREDLRERLRAWVELHGPLEVNGMIVGMNPKTALSYPLDALKKLLEPRGIDIWTVLKADNQKLEKVAKKDTELIKALGTIVVEKTTTEFKIKKATGR